MGLWSAVKRRRAQLLLLLFTLVLTLAAFETFLRLTDRFPTPPHPVVPQDPDVYRLYHWGYGLLSDTTVVERHPDGRTFTYRSNHHGFRDPRPIDEEDERVRIVVAGDSFVFGWGVEKHERFTDAIESRRADWRLDNVGMNGYGTDLALRAVEQVGLLARPDAIVFSIYTDAFPRVQPHFVGMGYEVPRFELDGGELVSVPYPTWYPWDHLRTRQLLRRALWSWRETEWKINAAVIERFLDGADEHRFRPIVLFFGGYWPESGVDRERRALVRRLCAARGAAMLDVSGVRELGRERAFIGIHWNATGHAWVADRLEALLEEELAD